MADSPWVQRVMRVVNNIKVAFYQRGAANNEVAYRAATLDETCCRRRLRALLREKEAR